jgi:hypothetical protein
MPLREIFEYVKSKKSVALLMLYRTHEEVEKTIGFLAKQGYRVEVYDPDLIPLINSPSKNIVVRKDQFRIEGDEAMILIYDNGMWIDITVFNGE